MSPNASKFLISGALVIVVLLIVGLVLKSHEAAERATITVNDMSLSVRLADNAWEQHRGLSGLEAADVKAQGMLFVFPDEQVRDFWMKDMKLDLDVLWIKDDRIASIDTNVSAPKAGEEPARMTSKPIPVDMVLEMPAGYVQRFGLVAGMDLKVELP
jgi:uncharacterized membrane protein (UPF0127 family)